MFVVITEGQTCQTHVEFLNVNAVLTMAIVDCSVFFFKCWLLPRTCDRLDCTGATCGLMNVGSLQVQEHHQSSRVAGSPICFRQIWLVFRGMVGIAASGLCESIGMRCGASSTARRKVKNIFLRTACSGLPPSMMWTCMHINEFAWLCGVILRYACLLAWGETGVSVRKTVITERTNTQSCGKISLHTYKLRCTEVRQRYRDNHGRDLEMKGRTEPGQN